MISISITNIKILKICQNSQERKMKTSSSSLLSKTDLKTKEVTIIQNKTNQLK